MNKCKKMQIAIETKMGFNRLCVLLLEIQTQFGGLRVATIYRLLFSKQKYKETL